MCAAAPSGTANAFTLTGATGRSEGGCSQPLSSPRSPNHVENSSLGRQWFAKGGLRRSRPPEVNRRSENRRRRAMMLLRKTPSPASLAVHHFFRKHGHDVEHPCVEEPP